MKATLRREGDDGRWPNYVLWGRMRTSTVALIVAFVFTWWLYETYRPPPGEPVSANQVVPPGFVPDPDYTWVPRTNVEESRTTTTTPTTRTPRTETTSPETPTTTTTPTSSTATVIDPDGPGPLPPQTLPVLSPPASTPGPTTTSTTTSTVGPESNSSPPPPPPARSAS